MNKKTKLLLGGVALAAVTMVCGACVIFAYISNEQDQETYGALTAACDGQAVPGAAAFTLGAGVHPAVYVEQAALSDGWTVTSGSTPSAWLSTGVSDTQLVICEGENETETLGTCSVTSTSGRGKNRRTRTRDVPRTRQRRSYRLVAAATGEVVAQGMLFSEDPQDCYTSENNDYTASIPSNGLERWLARASAGETDAAFSRGPEAEMFLVGGSAGGTTPANQLGEGCSGSIPAEPQHVVHFDAPSHAAFAVLPNTEVDTTIAVQLPGGQMLCNDDLNGMDPGVENDIPAGDVRIFVGTYSASGGNPSYRLRVSQRLPAQ